MKEIVTRWHPAIDATDWQSRAVQMILRLADVAIAARGRFEVVLAGGNTPQPVYRQLRAAQTDWNAWHVYFGDERCLPADDPDRNSAMAQESLLAHVPIPAAQIHPIPAELGAFKAAGEYARILKGLGNFDLVLLGLGEDGHTASLFPGQYWGIERNSRFVLPVFKSPKPPAERVTLSANRLSRAGAVLFLVNDESKRAAVERWRSGGSMPAAVIAPLAGVDVLLPAGLLDGAAG